MSCFVVSVNGKKVCSVRLTSQNTRSVQVSWIGSTKAEDMVFLHIGGMDGEEHVSWRAPQLRIGDEVTIKIGQDIDVADQPTARQSIVDSDEWSRSLGHPRDAEVPS